MTPEEAKQHDNDVRELLVNKIITALTPVLYGLTYKQISCLMDTATQKVLETLVLVSEKERKALRTTY